MTSSRPGRMARITAAIGIAMIAAGCTASNSDSASFATSSTAASATIGAAPNIVEKGDCLREGTNEFFEVPCNSPTATHVALERLPGADADCRAVPGVYHTYVDHTGGPSTKVCVGFAGRDPAKGINVAQVGDCVIQGEGVKGEQVPCTSPGAFRVLARFDNAVLAQQTCAGVPGTDKISGWRLKMVGLDLNPPGKGIFDVVFCLTPSR